MRNFPNQTTTRLNDREYHALVEQTENDIATILGGKTALRNLSLLIYALERRGVFHMVAVEGNGPELVHDDLAAIRRALELAHERAKDSRQVQ